MNKLILIELVVLGSVFAANQVSCDPDFSLDKLLDERTRKVYYETKTKSLEQIYEELQDLQRVCLITNDDPKNHVKIGRLHDVDLLISFRSIIVDAERCLDRLAELKESKERFIIYKNLRRYIEHWGDEQMQACSKPMQDDLNRKIAKVDDETRKTIDSLLSGYDGLRGPGLQNSQWVPIQEAMIAFLRRNYGSAELKDKLKFEGIVRSEILNPCKKVQDQLGKQEAGFYLRNYKLFSPLHAEPHWSDWLERSELCRIILDKGSFVLPELHKMVVNKNRTGCFSCFLRGKN